MPEESIIEEQGDLEGGVTGEVASARQGPVQEIATGFLGYLREFVITEVIEGDRVWGATKREEIEEWLCNEVVVAPKGDLNLVS